MARPWRRAALIAAAASALLAPPAAAVPDCPSQPRPRVVVADQGRLESIISDARGRLFYTDLTNNRLLRLDGPGQRPRVLSEGIARPGGLAFDSDGSLVTGFNGGPLSGVPGNAMAGLYRVNPETGAKRLLVSGLDQANGVVRGPDGSFYASNNIAGEIVRVLPDGRVEAPWADVESANGLAIDTKARYVLAAQTFTPAKIARIELAHPERVATYFAASTPDVAAGLDGLTRDGADRLFAAANGAGEVWRVGTDRQACALARGLGLPSAAAFGGGGQGFARRNLYVVTFTGRVFEFANATDRPPGPPAGSPATGPKPRLRLSVRPQRTRVGRRTRFRFKVTYVRARKRRPVRRALIRFAGRRVRTNRRGRASVIVRFRRAGRRRAVVSKRGFRSGRARVRVLRARRGTRRPRRAQPRYAG